MKCPYACMGSSVLSGKCGESLGVSDEADGSTVTIALERADRRSRSARADPAWAQIQDVGENHCRIPKGGFPAVQAVGPSPPQRHHSDRFHPADLTVACAKSLNHALSQLVGLMNGSVFLQPLPSSCAKYRALWPNPAATRRTKPDWYSLSASSCRDADTPMCRVPRQAFVDQSGRGLCPLEKLSLGVVAHASANRADSSESSGQAGAACDILRCCAGTSRAGRCVTAPEMFAGKRPMGPSFAAERCPSSAGVGTKRPCLLAGLLSR